MASINTLLLTGGEIHDHKGCGDEIQKHLESGGFAVERVHDDLNAFSDGRLEQSRLLVFYYTIGSITDEQYTGLSRFLRNGSGMVGIHSAADSFQKSDDYRALLGGYFYNHPPYRSYQVSVLDAEHEIMEGLTEFNVTDEQYITSYDPRVNVLANALYQGKPYPVAWTKNWGQGRVFYLALGHDPQACSADIFGTLLCRGGRWAAGSGAE